MIQAILQNAIRDARVAQSSSNYREVIAILAPIWAENHKNIEVFELLLYAFYKQKDLDAVEKTIRELEASKSNKHVLDEVWLDLYIAREDSDKACSKALAMIEQRPDYRRLHHEVVSKLSNGGMLTAFMELAHQNMIEWAEKYVLLALCATFNERDFIGAFRYLDYALEKWPSNAAAIRDKRDYTQARIAMLNSYGKAYLAQKSPGKASDIFYELTLMKPNPVLAQAYYLSARTVELCPPFKYYYHHKNPIGWSPGLDHMVAHLFFMLPCVAYFKYIAPIGHNLIIGLILLAGALAIPVYSLLPAFIQVLAFRYVPGYHLFKRPWLFMKGAAILAAWLFFIYNVFWVETTPFNLFLSSALLLHVWNFEAVTFENDILYKRIYAVYSVIAFGLALLSMLALIPAYFRFFIFGSWIPLMIVLISIAVYEKYFDE